MDGFIYFLIGLLYTSALLIIVEIDRQKELAELKERIKKLEDK